MLVLLGTSVPENAPLALSDPEMTCDLLNSTPLKKYWLFGFDGEGLNANE